MKLKFLFGNYESTVLLDCDTPSETIESVKQRLFDNWPLEAVGESPNTDGIRLLCLGKTLEDWHTVDSIKTYSDHPTPVNVALLPKGKSYKVSRRRVYRVKFTILSDNSIIETNSFKNLKFITLLLR